MGVRILNDEDTGACLYDSVTMTAFGPIFDDRDQAEEFLSWLPNNIDARMLTDKDLESMHSDFLQHLENKEDANDE